MTNKEYADSLRLIADFYEQHPDFKQPSCISEDNTYQVNGYHTREDLLGAAKLFGSFEKSYSDSFFYASKKFGQLTLRLADWRKNFCERIVVGTKVVQLPIYSEPIGYEEKVTEIVQWKCHPIMEEEKGEVSI